MAFVNIIVETRGAVGVIRLNRPQVLNALNAALIDELNAALGHGALGAGHERQGHSEQQRAHQPHRCSTMKIATSSINPPVMVSTMRPGVHTPVFCHAGGGPRGETPFF